MVSDGERLKTLVKAASHKVVLCAPFIKSKVLSTVLGVIPANVHVQIITRWRPIEIAVGVSDLDVYDVANDRENTELRLLQDLHAKIYIADDKCLVGSANLTARALGWAEEQNLELMIQTETSDPSIMLLLKHLQDAESATLETKKDMEDAAKSVESANLPEAEEMTGDEDSRRSAWLPRCAAPEKLYEIYKDPSTKIVAEGTMEDGKADLKDLLVGKEKELSSGDFTVSIQDSLQTMPAFAHIVEMVPQRITDESGRGLIADSRPEMNEEYVPEQWRIVRDWIRVFFADRFEVAPDSYVTRLKQKT